MISRLLKLALAIFFCIGHKIYRRICKQRGQYIPPSLVILTYHTIKVSAADKFEKQMNMLLNTGRPVSLSGNLSTLPNEHNIAVTFDDAYQSVLQNALPILRAKNIPATIFVPTGCLGEKPNWISDINHRYANEIVITEDQLKALPSNLITIGSHTVSHVNLNYENESTIKREITDSKKTIERLTGKEVTLFAAPYAIINEEYAELFKEAGYQRLFLNIPTYPATKTDLYIMGRTSVEPTDWSIEYRLKLLGAYQWLPIAISLKKNFIG